MSAPTATPTTHPSTSAAVASLSFSAQRLALCQAWPQSLTQATTAQTCLAQLSALADDYLRQLWQGFPLLAQQACLCAVGGYGRGEVYPYSDIDLLCLLPETSNSALDAQWEAFFGACWDAGLEVASSVRSVKQCLAESAQDLSVQTALLEARYLAGNQALFAQLQGEFGHAMQAPAFMQAKRAEARARHAKYQYTAYSLEPQVKEGVGSLRDVQLLYWLLRAAGLGHDWQHFWQDLQAAQILTASEAAELERSWGFLAGVRCRLHLLAERGEDRLLFDWQTSLALALGYQHQDQDPQAKRGVMRSASGLMMRDYYSAVKSVGQILQIALLGLEAKLHPEGAAQAPLDDARFLAAGGRLELAQADIFEREPAAILAAFACLQRHPDLSGFSAATLRALQKDRERIDADFRAQKNNQEQFLALFQAPRGVTRVMRLLNETGVLERYLPAFAITVGQTQHDLMHAYTVDQHILRVLANVRRFFLPEFAEELPACSALAQDFARPWLLSVAALFHDIAKGRGGDHSTLGAQEVEAFAQLHGLSAADSELLVFIVREHLILSQVAQKQDLSDPQVIADFAARMGSERHLRALYLFTVADIRGTNPQLWSVWKGQLLHTLYQRAKQVLAGAQMAQEAEIAQRQELARQELARLALPHEAQTRFWNTLEPGYFLRHEAADIAWHTRMLSKVMAQHPYFNAGRGQGTGQSAGQGGEHAAPEVAAPILVFARAKTVNEGLQVLVYARDRHDLFARICAFFGQANLSVMSAKIYTTPDGWALDTFELVTHEMPEHYRELLSMIEAGLVQELSRAAPLPAAQRGRVSRRVRHFPLQPRVELKQIEQSESCELEVSCADRVGLLYAIALVLAEQKVNMQSAKIVTLGERVEDFFVVNSPALQQAQGREALSGALLAALQQGG